MNQFTRFSLLLGMAAGLMATTPTPTLSFGEITLITPASAPSGACPSTTAPCYSIGLILSTAGTQWQNATGVNVPAGFQFDVNYDPTSLTVTVGTGANTSTLQVNTTTLPAANNPACPGQQNCTAVANIGPGQRAIIIGCCSTNQNTPTSGAIADGAVATIYVQPTSTPTKWTLTLPTAVDYMAATTQGGSSTAASAIPLVVGAAASDLGGTGVLDLSKIYLVGGISPMTTTNVGGFGSGKIVLADLIAELLYETGAPGYSLPEACTDFFDALDLSPADTATARGGDGQITLPDLITELLRETGAPGYGTWPLRTERGLTCTSNAKPNIRTAPAETLGVLELGPAQGAGGGQERVPVYLNAGRDLSRAAIAFSIGDETSTLKFTSAAGLSPSLVYDSQPGFIAAAFLSGFDVSSGGRTQLGYITGPAGSGANLRVFGVSATGLNDFHLYGVNVTRGSARQ